MANLYVVRDNKGLVSEPLSLDQVKERIRAGAIHEDHLVSIYPNQFALKAKEYSEFESAWVVDDEKTILFEHNKKIPSAHEEKTSLRTITNLDVTQIKGAPGEGASAPEGIGAEPVDTDRTGIREIAESSRTDIRYPEGAANPEEAPPADDGDSELKQQPTLVFERPAALIRDKGPASPKKKSKLPKRSFLVLVLLFVLVYDEYFDNDDERAKSDVVMTLVRPQLPAGGAGKVDPNKSVQIYSEALKPYLEDTVRGYIQAARGFQLALRYDPQNVKALAMLASSYLSLIDSSNKDENTFSVINKLIELSKLKDLDLVETLLAQVEFLATSHRYDAAIQRLIEYSKVTGKFDPILYYYLSWLYTQKHEFGSAAKYLNLIPASALPIPKLYYLRGLLHEENKEYQEAVAEYKRALSSNTQHAKSILGIVRVAEKRGELKQMGQYVQFLNSHPELQSPKEYVSGLIYRSKLALLHQNKDAAIASLEQAIRIEPKNEDLRLEYYSLLSQASKDSRYKNLAQMYALVLEGERYFRQGKYHEATAVYLQAADTFAKSEVPLEKLGDLFYQTGEFQKAETNYKKALEINPRSAETAIKLIDAQIRNHDWDDAQQYLARYRTHPALKSSIDRLAGDLSFHQGNYQAAITFYRKAMGRDTIDTEVYASYASALRELDQCKDAQFFYSLAQRLDPFNYGAILGAAKCLLKTDNVDVAVGRIQEELSRLPKARPDLVAGIAEIYYLAHEDERALQFANQAKELDPEYPESYKIEGMIYLRMMIAKKDVKQRALDAFKSYSDRKFSDPMGYLQRFEIFLKDANFERATEELNRVFEVSPRYPELHYRRAQLYIRMGRSKDALNELSEELKLNPRFVKAWVEQGNIYLRANNIDLAAQSFTKAMELDPMDASAKLGAANVNYTKRQFTSAIALYQSALALDRGNPEIYKRLGYAYRDSGDQQKATQAFRTYLDLAPDAPDRADFDRYR